MKRITLALAFLLAIFLVACGAEGDTEESDELAILEVEFNLPESAEPNETVKIEAIVTYGDEVVEDADEVVFEYWLSGEEENSEEVEGTHTENGSYVADVSFPEEGVYELYAHTTARGLHTMPLKSIAVGSVEEEHAEHDHSDSVHMHFMEPESIRTGEETELIVHLHLDGEELEGASVRYEMSPGDESEQTEWLDAEETVPGEYTARYEFDEAGTYMVVIHVEDDGDLHEHEAFELEVE